MPYFAFFHWKEVMLALNSLLENQKSTQVGASCLSRTAFSAVHVSTKPSTGHPVLRPTSFPLLSLNSTVAFRPEIAPVTRTSTRTWSPGTSRTIDPWRVVVIPAPVTVIEWFEMIDVLWDCVFVGRRFASVISTIWALCDDPDDDEGIRSHLVVNRARRTAMTASDSGAGFGATVLENVIFGGMTEGV